MPEVNVTELRQNLQAYLARVQRGERFSITYCGVVIAELSPPVPSLDAAAAARVRLARSVLRFDRTFDSVLDAGEWEADA